MMYMLSINVNRGHACLSLPASATLPHHLQNPSRLRAVRKSGFALAHIACEYHSLVIDGGAQHHIGGGQGDKGGQEWMETRQGCRCRRSQATPVDAGTASQPPLRRGMSIAFNESMWVRTAGGTRTAQGYRVSWGELTTCETFCCTRTTGGHLVSYDHASVPRSHTNATSA